MHQPDGPFGNCQQHQMGCDALPHWLSAQLQGWRPHHSPLYINSDGIANALTLMVSQRSFLLIGFAFPTIVSVHYLHQRLKLINYPTTPPPLPLPPPFRWLSYRILWLWKRPFLPQPKHPTLNCVLPMRAPCHCLYTICQFYEYLMSKMAWQALWVRCNH